MHSFTKIIVLILFVSQAVHIHTVMNYSVAIIFEVGTSWAFDKPMIGPAITIGRRIFLDILKDRLNIEFIQINKKEKYRTCSAEGYASLVAGLYFRNHVDGFIGPGKIEIKFCNFNWLILITGLKKSLVLT